jgi:hypothetical protein
MSFVDSEAPIGEDVIQEVLRVMHQRKGGRGHIALAGCKIVDWQRAVNIFPCGAIVVGQTINEDHPDIWKRHNRGHEQSGELQDAVMISGEAFLLKGNEDKFIKLDKVVSEQSGRALSDRGFVPLQPNFELVSIR